MKLEKLEKIKKNKNIYFELRLFRMITYTWAIAAAMNAMRNKIIGIQRNSNLSKLAISRPKPNGSGT
jgi:hypothetical protein